MSQRYAQGGVNPLLIVDASLGNEVVTLTPLASDRRLTIRRLDAVSGNTVTVQVKPGLYLDGALNGTTTVATQSEKAFLADDTGFRSFGGGGGTLATGSVGTNEVADGSIAAADLNMASVAAAIAARAELTSTYAPLTVADVMASGPLWYFGGDSITNGSASNNFVWSYMPQAISMVGGLVARQDSIEGGTPGDTSTALLARLPAALAQYRPQAVSIMIGTNDAGNAVPLATTISNLIAIIKAAKAYGGVVLCTIPPRGTTATTAVKTAVQAINAWIRLNGPGYGCEIADVNLALADPATGDYLTGYDSGDAVHPSPIAHYVMAGVVAAAMKRAAKRTSPYGALTGAGQGVISSDPLNARATVISGSWFEQAGGSGTAPTYSMVADTSGVLPAGRWAQMDFDGTASGGVRRLATTESAGFAVGDWVMHCAHIQIEDVSGTWLTDVNSQTAQVAMGIYNQAATIIFASLSFCPGLRDAATGYYNIGPVTSMFQIPAATTSLLHWYSLVVPTGKHIKLRVGAAGLVNLTTLGMQAVANYGPTIVNT